ncbi:MAG TPA: ATP synthase F1 subunit epsilon [Sporichthyaceae bacterium]|jgi:F-type H+-transporting ATPase subunit epsilon|nr:ATP synthase F1 subunit epsilon [Sporichthyaceae bacterium]
MVVHTKFPTRILTPDGEVFSGEVEMVSTRTTLGLIGIMARHAPLLASLEPTELRLRKAEGDVERFAQSEGYLQVGQNQALLLVEEVVPVAKLDAEKLREQLRVAEQEIAQAGEDTEKRRVAQRDKKRCEVFLSLAK